jgi:hypothetical protein
MDDVDLSGSPLLLMLVGGILLLLFLYLFWSSRKTLDRAAAPRRSLSYECVATPAAKADAALRGKFPALAALGPADGLTLIRFGLFNWGALDLSADQIDTPVTVVFRPDVQVLSAEFGEAIKTDFQLPEPLAIRDNTVVFPKFGIAARGTLIFNFIVRGDGVPESVVGEFDGGTPIRRLG